MEGIGGSILDIPKMLYLHDILIFLDIKEIFRVRVMCKGMCYKKNEIVEFMIVREKQKLQEFETDINLSENYPKGLYSELQQELKPQFLDSYFQLRSILVQV